MTTISLRLATSRWAFFTLGLFLAIQSSRAADLAKWTPQPKEWKGATLADGKATLTGDKWSFLTTPDEFESVRCEAKVTIEQPAQQLGFFGFGRTLVFNRTLTANEIAVLAK